VNALLRPLVALLSLLSAVPALAQNFYEARFQAGVIDFNRGAYARAADELRVAAFGRVDDIPSYITAEVYLAVTNDRLEHAEDARVAAMKVLQAERITPSYAALKLPSEVRASFEQLLPALLTRDQLSNVPVFARLASQAPAVQTGAPRATRQTAVVPTPTKQPNVAVTAPKEDNKAASQPQPALDYGRLALERVAAGDEAGAKRYADLAFAADDTNANAHTALAQIGNAHKSWNDVAEHYAVVRTRRRLTDDETAAYLIALIKTGHVADAMGVRRTASNAVLSRPDVRDALQTIEPKAAPQPVAPQPVAPQPIAPQPIAPQPVAPQPVAPQPIAPQPVVPTPVPTPLPQPPAPVRSRVTPAPAPVVPAPAPQETAPGNDEPIADQIAAAERMVAGGNIVGARTELRRIALLPNVPRSDRQSLARALSQTALYAESSAQYRKTYPLKAGEETHMFYEAVNRFELGDYSLARQLITRALPTLPQTPAILAYRDRIMAQQ
jgi:tetratricopeptide (TPR) repeat protein